MKNLLKLFAGFLFVAIFLQCNFSYGSEVPVLVRLVNAADVDVLVYAEEGEQIRLKKIGGYMPSAAVLGIMNPEKTGFFMGAEIYNHPKEILVFKFFRKRDLTAVINNEKCFAIGNYYYHINSATVKLPNNPLYIANGLTNVMNAGWFYVKKYKKFINLWVSFSRDYRTGNRLLDFILIKQ